MLYTDRDKYSRMRAAILYITVTLRLKKAMENLHKLRHRRRNFATKRLVQHETEGTGIYRHVSNSGF